MRLIFPMLMMLIAGLALGGGSATLVWSGMMERSRAISTGYTETKAALSYACGYRDGQVAIMNRLPTLFSRGTNSVNGCSELKAAAIKNGFTTAAAD